MATHLLKGQLAERQARDYLEQQGLRWLAGNYRTKLGEIDLIMQDRENLVFVEVRYRNTDRFGGACESVTADKQRKLIAAAQHYLMESHNPSPCRFDIIGVTHEQGEPSIEWIKDAFQQNS